MIVMIATEWSSAAGGISAFNIALTRALARAGRCRIACAIVDARAAPRMRDEVLIIPVPEKGSSGRPVDDCGDNIITALGAHGWGGQVEHWIGHDIITGIAAVIAAERHGGQAVAFHHMNYLAYQNLGGGRGDDTVNNRERQIHLFGQVDLAVGVGVALTRHAEELGAPRTVTVVPGFPEIASPPKRTSDRLMIVTGGRFDTKSEPVKRVEQAVQAYGKAIGTAAGNIPALKHPVMTLLGVEGSRQAALEALARSAAGRVANLVAAGFTDDPAALATHMSRANLAIMPSCHEGFGLVGWEAIGVASPLILGHDTGLAAQLEATLGIRTDGLVQILDLTGDGADVDHLSDAILNVARDIPRALKKAGMLSDMLRSELGCSWDHAARSLLEALEVTRASAPASPPSPSTAPTVPMSLFKGTVDNRVSDCVELRLSAGQGATEQSIELIAELRFGTSELAIKGIEAEVGLSRVRLRVTPDHGVIEGYRYGDPSRAVAGVQALSGGVWQFEANDAKPLLAKMLGDEALCRVEAPPPLPASVRVEVTAQKSDLTCTIRGLKRPKDITKQKVMGVFLKTALTRDDSGHVVFSSGQIKRVCDAD